MHPFRLFLLTTFTAILLISWYFCLPEHLFTQPASFVLNDRNGNLLSARIAEDGQWRFPEDTIVPDKFRECIIAFEDKRFTDHCGIDPCAISRAIVQNLFSGRKVSGASTITMQVIRLSRNRERNIFQKLTEAFMATRLEAMYTKEEILAMYASYAPFGGNVVGLSAASWRYYGKPPKLLSWAEAATLAVLPNSPALIHPGRNREFLRKKRDRLLKKMVDAGKINEETYTLALLESLPDKPLPLPDYAPHLMTRVMNDTHINNLKQDRLILSSVDQSLQSRVVEILDRHGRIQQANGVHNLATLVIDVKNGKVIAYAGNTGSFTYGPDNIMTQRSTGSVLKPVLYACMLNDGLLLPEMLIPDIPVVLNSYTPRNYNNTFDGVVPADKALARSLNIPAVTLLQQYSVPVFLDKLKKLGFTTFRKPSSHYGLSLILGGGETNLWELCKVYTSMAQTLNHFNSSGNHMPASETAITYLINDKPASKPETITVLSPAAIWQTFESMVKVSRPDEEKYWANFSSSGKIAWKTGTSFGNRDAWAVGITPDYVVGIWAGNNDGSGRTGLTGISAAAPVLFDIFNTLQPVRSEWFSMPAEDMSEVEVCAVTGYLAGSNCDEHKKISVKNIAYKNLTCPYHHLIHLDSSGRFRVNADCHDAGTIRSQSWFVLPPSVEKYYLIQNPGYRTLPSLRNDCSNTFLSADEMVVNYPRPKAVISLPELTEGNRGSLVFEAAHSNLSATVFWHIDEQYAGKTTVQHQLSVSPEPGKHKLILIDDAGNKVEQEFEITGT